MKLIDNALPKDMFHTVQTTVKNKAYRHGWTSAHKSDFDKFFNAQYIRERDSKNRRDITSQLENCPSDDVLEAWQYVQAHYLPEHCVPIRVYSNMQVYGTESHPHTDAPAWHDDVSAVLYCVGDNWRREWGGATLEFAGDGTLSGVEPKANRIALFEGRAAHQAQPLARSCTEPRFMIVFKARRANMHQDFFSGKGWDELKHGRTVFSEHLFATAWHAKQQGASDIVQQAALYHAAYGTAFFPLDNPATQAELLPLIGQDAEALVRAFCDLPAEGRPAAARAHSPELVQLDLANAAANKGQK